MVRGLFITDIINRKNVQNMSTEIKTRKWIIPNSEKKNKRQVADGWHDNSENKIERKTFLSVFQWTVSNVCESQLSFHGTNIYIRFQISLRRTKNLF